MGFALGHQSCDHQAHRRAQVRRHHRRAGQAFDAVHNRGAALGFDMRAHAVEFGHMHIAVFEDGFGQHAGAIGHAQHRHKLRLHIGGKAGIGCGRNRQRLAACRPMLRAVRP